MAAAPSIDPHAIEADLKARLRGEVACDQVSRALYSTAACIYRVKPLAVVAPRDADDVAAVVNYCGRHGVPITARGAGSALAGQTLGEGAILDFTPHMHRILEVGEGHVWVEPGLVCDDLNAALAGRGRWFPPDPSSSGYCTLGGMIANNSAGAHSVKYGTTIDWVEELDLLLADGTRLRTRPVELDGPDWQRLVAAPSREGALHAAVRELVERHADLIREHQPKTSKNASGYRLERVIKDGALNLSRLVCGSEGTLAIVLAAKLRTAPLPKSRRMAVLHLPDLQSAGRAVQEILPLGPSAIELHERHVVDIIREGRPELAEALAAPGQSQLFVEFDGDSADAVSAELAGMRRRIVGEQGLAVGCIEPASGEESDRLWQVRKATLPLLYRRPGRRRATAFIEDVAVGAEHVPEYVQGLYRIFERHGIEAAVYGHAAQGNFHVRPFLDLHDAADVATMRAVADEVFDFTIALGGTLSGEHGDGIARTEYLRQLYGPVTDLFAETKRIFDPDTLLNPGKIVPDPRRDYALTEPLRFDADYGSRPMGERLHWQESTMAAEAERCHGCATCRTLPVAKTRMCPVYKALRTEEATPRAKANVLREIAAGRLDPKAIEARLDTLADLCLLCGSCRQECPSQVDVPKLMLEAKARLAAEGRPRLWRAIVSRLDSLSGLAAPLAPVVNALNRLRPARWLIEKVAHIDRRRPLPRLARRSLHKRLRSHQTQSKTKNQQSKIVYFPDVFAEHNDPALGEALIALLERAGVRAEVPKLRACGILAMCYGRTDAALRTIRANLEPLREYAQAGMDILVTEPTALLCLRREYADFVGEAAREVAERCHDAVEYLAALHREGRLDVPFADLPLTLAWHTPCHTRALDLTGAPELLAAVPELSVVPIEEGCCGIAGSAGLRRSKYDLSMQIGEGLFRRVREACFDGAATSCSTCRMQMEHGAGKPVYHPLHLLARSALGMPLPGSTLL